MPGFDAAAGWRIDGAMTVLTRARLQFFPEPGALGVVQNVRFVRCYWPHWDRPTNPFAAGSENIEVCGPPTPRNLYAPGVVRFIDQEQRCPGARISTRGDCFLLRERVSLGKRMVNVLRDDGRIEQVKKEEFDIYVAPLTQTEADDLASGKVGEATLRAAKEFRHIDDGRPLVRIR